VIDPEFDFFGPPDYDVGVLVAHIELAGQASALSEDMWDGYAASPGRSPPGGWLAGVEMMRRLLRVPAAPVSRLGAQASAAGARADARLLS